MGRKILTTIALLILASALAGCHQYDVEVAVNEDGSGTRRTVFGPDLDESFTETDLPRVFALPSERGWTRGEGRGEDPVYTREAAAAVPADWPALGVDVRVSSRGDGGGGTRDTGLRNEVSLETGRTDAGRTYTYRERLVWIDAKRDLVGVMVEVYGLRLRETAPDLPEVVVGEACGLFAARVLQIWETCDLTGDEARFEAELSRTLQDDMTGLVERHGLGHEPQLLVELALLVLDDADNRLETVITRDLVGVAHAMLASLTLSVSMPGEILDTNGEIGDDGAVQWRIGLLDALDRPLEMYVRALVRD